jgi:hypothetical protein
MALGLGEEPRADPAGVVGVLVKVLDGGGAHHGETLLQGSQFLPGKDLFRRLRAAGHDPEILADSPFIRPCDKLTTEELGQLTSPARCSSTFRYPA